MADAPQKVIVQANRIDASILPPGFSTAYRLAVIQQTTDLKNIADSSNGAAEQAYQATIKNAEQDVMLNNHEGRLVTLKATVDGHEVRITANEVAITSILSRLTTAESSISGLSTRVGSVENSVSAISGDYVSKSATSAQSIASSLNITTSLSVNGTKVIGAQRTGWSAAGGTANRGAFNANEGYSVSSTYTQSEIQTLANAVILARQRIKALEDDMRAHGLIN